MEIEVLAIEINAEPIELYKLLKIANLVGGGGEAKLVIADGYVYLNGEVEYQKRKKVYAEDIVQFNGEAIMPILAETQLETIGEVQETLEYSKAELSSHATNEQFEQGNDKKPAKSKPSQKSKPASKNKTSQKSKKTAKANKENSAPKTNSRTGRKSISF